MRPGFLNSSHDSLGAGDRARQTPDRSGGARVRAKAAAFSSRGAPQGLPLATWPDGLPRVVPADVPVAWKVTPELQLHMAHESGRAPDSIEVRTVLEAPDSPCVRMWAERQRDDACIGVCIVNPHTFEKARGQGACRAFWSSLDDGRNPCTWMHMAYARFPGPGPSPP